MYSNSSSCKLCHKSMMKSNFEAPILLGWLTIQITFLVKMPMRQIPFQVVKANKLSIGLLRNIGLNVPKEIQFFLMKVYVTPN